MELMLGLRLGLGLGLGLVLFLGLMSPASTKCVFVCESVSGQ